MSEAVASGAMRLDLFFIVLSAVIVGGVLVAFSAAAMIRYSRNEDAGTPNYSKSGRDLSIAVITAALCLYGIWRAGLFG